MGTTPGGLPYPEDTGLVTAGDNDMKALATAVRYAAGSVNCSSILTNASANVAITFPAGLFTTAPSLSVVTGNGRCIVSVPSAPTASGATIQWNNWTGSTAPGPFGNRWVAVQSGLAAATAQAEAPEVLDGAVVTCPTPGCLNEGVALSVSTSVPDVDGNLVPVDSIVCGPCGAELTPGEGTPDA